MRDNQDAANIKEANDQFKDYSKKFIKAPQDVRTFHKKYMLWLYIQPACPLPPIFW